jgi:hypothetical protein
MRRQPERSDWSAEPRPNLVEEQSRRRQDRQTGPDDALSMAIDLYRSPGVAWTIRRSPLPSGVIFVIRLAAGCPESSSQAVESTGLESEDLSRIASLYLLVALFGQEVDPHRTLGVVPGVSLEEVNDHRKWLLKWLHPDRNRNQSLSGLSVRVLSASAHLVGKSAAPASAGQTAAPPFERRPKRRMRHRWIAMPLND